MRGNSKFLKEALHGVGILESVMSYQGSHSTEKLTLWSPFMHSIREICDLCDNEEGEPRWQFSYSAAKEKLVQATDS